MSWKSVLVAGGHVLRVNGWVDEADGRFAVGSQLLVDQRNVAGPHRRAKLVPPYSLAVQVVWSAQT